MFLESNFWCQKLNPKSLCSWVPTLNAESWIVKGLNSWRSTFNAKSWKPRALGFWSSTFDVESWRPRPLGFQSSISMPKVVDWNLSALGLQLSMSKVGIQNQMFLVFKFDTESWDPRLLYNPHTIGKYFFVTRSCFKNINEKSKD